MCVPAYRTWLLSQGPGVLSNAARKLPTRTWSTMQLQHGKPRLLDRVRAAGRMRHYRLRAHTTRQLRETPSSLSGLHCCTEWPVVRTRDLPESAHFASRCAPTFEVRFPR